MGKRKGRGRKPQGESEEVVRETKREELQREIQMGAAGARQLRETWRKKMMSLNLPVIKEDLQVAWRAFDQALDNKDYGISLLLDALDDAEDQKTNKDIVHVDQIDNLIKEYRKQLDERMNQYRCSIKKMLDSDHEFVDGLTREQVENERYLQTVIFSTEQGIASTIETMKLKNLPKSDSRKESNEHIRNLCEAICQRTLRNFSKELTKVLRDYETNTKKKRKEFEKIRKKDENDQNIISRQSVRIQQLYIEIVVLRNRITKFKVKSRREVTYYLFERDYYYGLYLAMHKRLYAERILDREQLRVVASEYNATIEFLTNNLAKVEKIFTLMDLCQKYETYKDKVILYPLSTVFEDDEIEDLSNPTIKPMQKLIKLVLLAQNDIKELKMHLEYENARFHTLKQNVKICTENFTSPMCVREKEDCKAVPMIFYPKDIIKKCNLKVIDTNNVGSKINIMLNKTF